MAIRLQKYLIVVEYSTSNKNGGLDMMSMQALISILILCETAGHPDPNNAVHDGGAGYGCLAIQEAVIQDVNEKYGTSFTLEDRGSELKSREICMLYLQRWLAHYTKKTGKQPTDEIACRIWNGGPSGWKKKATDKYAKRYYEMKGVANVR